MYYRFAKPIKEIEDKWHLVPAFLRTRGLVKQHTDSFNYLMNQGLSKDCWEVNIARKFGFLYILYFIKYIFLKYILLRLSSITYNTQNKNLKWYKKYKVDSETSKNQIVWKVCMVKIRACLTRHAKWVRPFSNKWYSNLCNDPFNVKWLSLCFLYAKNLNYVLKCSKNSFCCFLIDLISGTG